MFETTCRDVRYAGRMLRLVTDLPVVWPHVLATAAMLAIAFVAAYGPACNAMNVEPVEALRQ